ncbi:MAG: response regulator [Patescibacteria group bacterium]|jgi:CheY-like chemotaxis protein
MSTKILIVEDDPATRRMYVRILSRLNQPVTVLQTDNVDEAREVFLANSDIQLAILDGSPTGASNSTTTDLAKEIKQQSPACRLVAVTGRPDLYPELLATCHAVVEKPFEKPELLAALGLS